MNEFKIKFGGELHLIDIHTFTAALTNIATIAEEINTHLNSNKIIEMQLKTLEPGSFVAGIRIKEIDRTQSSVFEPTSTNEIAQEVITKLAELNEYKKHIGSGGETVVENTGREVVVQNERGDKKVFDHSVYDLYSNNKAVSDSISNNYSVLEGDTSVTSFELLDADNRPLFKAERENFDELSTSSIKEAGERKSKIETAELRIHKLVFDPKYKWEFWYKSSKISANILDENFFKGIEDNEKFGKGDVLIVELQTNLIFDTSVDIFILESYQINRVIEHTPKEKAHQLDFGM